MAQTKQGAMITAAKVAGLPLDEFIALSVKNKKCSKCKCWQPKANFNSDKSRGDGLSTKCQTCIRVKVKKSHKGRVSTFKGHKHTEEAKALMRVAQVGKTPPMLGKTHTIETRQLISETRRNSDTVPRGENHYAYKDGKVGERRGLRFTREYKQWRYDVFLRDKFICQKCGDNKGGNLNAHHIQSWAEFPDLRFVVDNGVTYCEDCHKLEHAA